MPYKEMTLTVVFYAHTKLSPPYSMEPLSPSHQNFVEEPCWFYRHSLMALSWVIQWFRNY